MDAFEILRNLSLFWLLIGLVMAVHSGNYWILILSSLPIIILAIGECTIVSYIVSVIEEESQRYPKYPECHDKENKR